ncbi:Lp29 family lipoprotein [Leptospira haakeii]|uniref:Lipoprotein n=1 Tax=Leptospira haakeii TaxID=2023198 RepID=A0ABX4PI26_9LEPT|nr:hypothetical protein [Leptospira haakeii]PKA14332.1 hypothetical protein CH363_19230 [Leptospira haakeii]PKA18190.1 hypothetical protein CH377_18985 [Leptospira haakeii]
MKFKISILMVWLFTLSCVKSFYKEPKIIKDNSVLEIKKNRIALVGFLPFKETGGRSIRVASLDYENSLKKYVKIGTPIEQITENGIDLSVPAENVNRFVNLYIGEVKKTGLDEINKVLLIKESTKGKIGFLRKRDVDFYVVAILGPPFARPSISGYALSLLTYFPFLLSLGTVPNWGIMENKSTFLIFDSKLELLKRKEYDSSYHYLISWFVPKEGNRTYDDDSRAMEPYLADISEFEMEFLADIQTLKGSD